MKEKTRRSRSPIALPSLTLFLLVALVAFALFGCGGKKSDTVRIGILQLVQHPSLDDVREGFLERLQEAGYEEGKNITVDYQNAANDQANLKSMGERLVGNSDLVLTIATPAAQTVVNLDPQIPVLFSAVTDPIAAGLVESLEKPGREVTGMSDMAPIDRQVQLLLSLKEMNTVGIIYNGGEENSVIQAEAARAELEKQGVTVVEMTVTSTNDVGQVMQVLVSKVEGIYIPTDNTLASAAATVGEIAREAGIPVVPASEGQVETGGVATLGIDYHGLGRSTADQAVEILKGKKASDVPVGTPTVVELTVNREMAEAIGLDPDAIKVP